VALQKKPDLIHLTTSGSLAAFRDFVVCFTARLWRIPVIYHIRFGRVPEIAVTNTFEWHVLAMVMRLAHVVVAITPETTETIRRYLPHIRVEYVPNPIDFSELPIPIVKENNDRHIALFLGWVIPAKGVEELVQAWAKLCPPRWELILVGPSDEDYQKYLLRRYHPNNLRFVGELTHEDAMQLLAESDLFVLPSYTEGFPNVILEAMALGKPIIATNVGAIEDMLSDDCGLLINPKDVAGLIEALSRLTQDKNLRCELGARVYEKVRQKYSIDVIFSRYIQIWQSLM
jgi:glycosyltransferase involved in cell wall biosynthesis